ncbi:hypothetical protein ACFL09_00155 [Planctomycetota bacterium]
MKAAIVVLIVILTGALVCGIRGDLDFSIVHTLPLLGGHKPSLWYDGGAVCLVLLFLWGLGRLRRRGEDTSTPEPSAPDDTEEYELDDDPWDESD